MFERKISEDDIAIVITSGEVIKGYPDDTPYPSMIIFGLINKVARTKAYFDHREYKQQVEEAFNSLKFRIDEEKLQAARKEVGDKIG